MADAALVRLSLVEAADRIRRRAISPVALAEAVLAQIDTLNPTLNAFTTLVPREQVLAPARAAEREIAAGAYRGLLHGIPVSVKDLIDTAGCARPTARACSATTCRSGTAAWRSGSAPRARSSPARPRPTRPGRA